MNDPSNPGKTFDFANLNTDNIERIEVVRGNQSVAYGSEAIGGVINIITKQGQKDQTSLQLNYGRYKTHQERLSLQRKFKKAQFSLSVSHIGNEGFSSADEDENANAEKDGYRLSTVSTGLQLQPQENLSIHLSGRFHKAKTDLDAFGGSGGDDPNFLSLEQALYAQSNIKASFFEKKYEPIFFFGASKIKRENENLPDLSNPNTFTAQYNADYYKTSLQHNIHFHPKATLMLGTELKRESFDSNSNFGNFNKQSVHTLGNFLQFHYAAKNLFFDAGLRVDKHKFFGTQETYRLAPGLKLPTQTLIKVSYATGFKAPTLFQLFDAFSGNPNLQPDRSTSFDISIEQPFSKNSRASLTFFSNRFKETIEFDNNSFAYVNLGEAKTHGVEVQGHTSWNSFLNLSGNITFLSSEDKSTGQDLLRRPQQTAYFKADFKPADPWLIGPEVEFVGKRTDFGNVAMPSYALVHLRGSYSLQSLKLTARINNVLNKNYQVISGFGAAGFNWNVGLQWSI